jgi:FkbM family methyltransferase
VTLRDTRARFAAGAIPKAEYIREMHASHRRLFEYADHLRDTDIAEIRITDGRVEMVSREGGVAIVCDPDDMRMAPLEILNFGRYEPEQTRLLLSLIEDGATVLDVGANVGWYSLLIARRHPRCTVHAFEPIPHTYGYLEQNIALNRVGNVHAHNLALSDADGEADFYWEPSLLGRASAADLSEHGEAQRVKRPMRRLDAVVAELGLAVDFIKCDCEGSELRVFQGGRGTLDRCRPAVLTELLRKWAAKLGYHPNQVIELFRDLGYGCFTARGDRLVPFVTMTDETVETNFFFLHRERHAEKIRELSP